MQPVFHFRLYILHWQMLQKSLSETKLLPSLRKKIDMLGNYIYSTQGNTPCLKRLVYAVPPRTLGLDPRVVRMKYEHTSYPFIHLRKTLSNISN